MPRPSSAQRSTVLPNADIHAIYLERNKLSAKLRSFVEFLGEYLRDAVGKEMA